MEFRVHFAQTCSRHAPDLSRDRLTSLSSLFTPDKASLSPDKQLAPGLGVHNLLNPMYPHPADDLLFPRVVGNYFALTNDPVRNCPGFGISVNDAMPKDASIFGKHREVTAFLEILQALVTPVAVLVSNPSCCIAHQPPSVPVSLWRKQTPFISFIICHLPVLRRPPNRAIPKPFTCRSAAGSEETPK